MGRLSGVIGKKKVIVVGLVVFTTGGILSAISPTFFILLGGRVMQGSEARLFRERPFLLRLELLVLIRRAEPWV